jgi:hypothetical protein
MTLTHRETEALRELAQNGRFDEINAIAPTSLTLLATIELSCCRFLSLAQHARLLLRVDSWTQQFPMLKSAVDTLRLGKIPCRSQAFVRQCWEFFPILNSQWADNDHHLFEARFTAAAKAVGFAPKTSIALAGAFREMTDNIVQHSGNSIADNVITFAVGDTGRGVLDSLHENPQWQHLTESADALEAITRKHASRRVGMGAGGGFLQLFKSLADLNGDLVFRSGDGILEIQGAPDIRNGTKGSATPFPGLQLAVSCSC